MTKIERKLLHKCGASFWPEEVIRLYAHEKAIALGYRYMDYMVGVCRCGEDVMAYIGMNDLQHDVGYERISPKKNVEWSVRTETNRVREQKQRLRAPGTLSEKDLGESPVESLTVNGCKRDKISGRYYFSEMIPVR